MRYLQIIIITSFVFLISCSENPTEIERTNYLDPNSQSFDSDALKLKLGSIKISLDSLKKIRVSWPYLAFSEKYEIKRKSSTEDQYIFIKDVFEATDTVYIDENFEYDTYSYQINYYFEGEEIISYETVPFLNNWIEGPSLPNESSLNLISNQTVSFAMKINKNKVLVHHMQEFVKSPVISLLDLNSFTWETVKYPSLHSELDRVRLNDIMPIGNTHFVVLKKFTRNYQPFLGYICSVEATQCSNFGWHYFNENWKTLFNTYYMLNDEKILFLGKVEDETSIDKSYAYIFNPINDQLSKISPPSESVEQSTLTALNTNVILHCQNDTNEESSSVCKLYDIEKDKWESTTPYPQKVIFPNSILLNDNRVFLFGKSYSNTAKAQIYNSENESWEVTSPTSYSTKLIDSERYTNQIFKSLRGNLLVQTHSYSSNGKAIDKYYLEEYDLEANLWIKSFQLPSKVKTMHNIIKLESGRYLVLYSPGSWDQDIKSAIFYWN